MSFKRILKSNYNYNPILNNRFILYFICFLALVDILYLLNIGDIKSFLVFISTGLLTTFFNKNMIVVLVIALCITHIYKYGSSAYSNKKVLNYHEGLENMDKKDKKEKEKLTTVKNMDKKEKEKLTTVENMDKKEKETLTTVEKEKNDNKKDKDLSMLKSDYKDFQSIEKNILESISNIDLNMKKAEGFIEKYEKYKNNNESENESK